MFPYLKAKEEFLKDCEESGFHFERCDRSDENRFVLVENDEKTRSSYAATRGCTYNCRICNGFCPDLESDNDNLCSFNRCASIPDDVKNSAKNCPGCSNISLLTAYLTENVDKSNWDEVPKGKRVGSVAMSMIQSWCQSVCIYVHDVLKSVPGNNIAVGLEYYTDNTEKENYRADVVLAGYGRDGRGKLVCIELKQYDNEYMKKHPDLEDEAISQVCNYSQSIISSVEGFKSLKIDIECCVYFHNYFSSSVSRKKKVSGKEVFICYGGTDKGKDRTLGIKEMSGFISGIFSEDNSKDPGDIIKKIKEKSKILSVEDLASVIYGRKYNSQKEKWSLIKYDSIYKMLRPDQKNAMDKIVSQLNGDNKETDSAKKVVNYVRGTSGSGKTLLTVLLIRYCLDNDLSVVLSYFGAAPINAIFKKFLFNMVKIESKQILCNLTQQEKDFIDNTDAIDLSGRKKDGIINLSDYIKEIEKIGRNQNVKIPENIKRLKKLTIAHSDNFGDLKSKHDLLIFDEFHRFGYNKSSSAESCKNLKKIINRSQNRVFLIDELQRISKKDIGNDFYKRLKSKDYCINTYALWSQFRCNGCEGFVSWVERELQTESPYSDGKENVIRKTSVNPDYYLDSLDFKAEIADITKKIKRKTIGSKSVAFLSEEKNVNILNELFGTHECFQTKSEMGNTEIRDDRGKIFVKNAYVVQGIEFEEVFVIIDGKLDYKNGKVCFSDEYIRELWAMSIPFEEEYNNILLREFGEGNTNSIKKWKTFAKAISDKRGISENEARCYVYGICFEKFMEEELNIVKNRYRVLLTRGLKHCYIYAVNENMRKHLKEYESRGRF